MSTTHKHILATTFFLMFAYSKGHTQANVGSGTYIVVGSGMKINAGGNITVQSGGTLNASSGTIILSGSTQQSVTGTVTAKYLTLNNSTGAVIPSGSVSVYDTYTPTSGTLTTNGNLVIESTASLTARIAPGSNSGGYISGDVTVKRYIPARRAWRLLSVPFTSSNSIYNSWQNGGVYTAGVGTHITNSAGTGFDGNSGSSMKYWDVNAQLLGAVTNTGAALSAYPAYFLFVRGDRNPQNLTYPNTNNTTLAAKGALYMGNQDVTVRARPSALVHSYTLSANLYASAIQFTSLNRTNVMDRYYVWDPKLNTVGGYVLFDASDGYLPSVGGGSYTNGVASTTIESGQAFIVEATTTTTGTLQFVEAAKTTGGANVFRTTNSFQKLNMQLSVYDGNTYIPADGITALWDAQFSNDMSDDALNMSNLTEDLSFKRDNALLSMEKRSAITVNDTLFIQLDNAAPHNYKFRFYPSNFIPGINAWLQDAFLNTSTPLDLYNNSEATFDITTTASAANNRFRIVFKQAGALPLFNIALKGIAKDKANDLTWKVEQEKDIQHYELQRSATGTDFNSVATKPAKGNNLTTVQYNVTDDHPFKTTYYRVKALTLNNETKYSAIIKLGNGNIKAGIAIYPTLVSTRFTVLLQETPAATYTVTITNMLGQTVLKQDVQHSGNTAGYVIELPALAKGTYTVTVKGGESMETMKVIIQ